MWTSSNRQAVATAGHSSLFLNESRFRIQFDIQLWTLRLARIIKFKNFFLFTEKLQEAYKLHQIAEKLREAIAAVELILKCQNFWAFKCFKHQKIGFIKNFLGALSSSKTLRLLILVAFHRNLSTETFQCSGRQAKSLRRRLIRGLIMHN